MPQKVCERRFCHVMAFSQFFEMPHFFMFEFFEMPHFSYLILKMGKMGHFKKLARDQF